MPCRHKLTVSALATIILSELSPQGCKPVTEIAEKAFLRPIVVENALQTLAKATSAITIEEGVVCLHDPVELAIAAVKNGASETIVARSLDWKMFEDYTAKALEEAGYTVYRSLRVPGKGGLEVDVLGLDPPAKLGIVVDCKHWNPRTATPSRLREAARQHRERLERLAKLWWKLRLPRGTWRLIPVIITLRENVPKLAEGVS
ncbi:restriction endonuclease [Hyperthermus butylicus]|uniref:restriction endonuclease n=1 Tax=Hyperthermus butylicus TaxID=54248 RepID=UPI0003209310|nr:restriction endonuclease [Hyperthermus butylicus]